MRHHYKNLVFSGGGVLGIAYLGTLEYLYKTRLISPVINLAGTSAGAITACLTSFDLPFKALAAMLDTLDYRNVPIKDTKNNELRLLPKPLLEQVDGLFDNVDCVYRLIKSYGWYSSDYLYAWLQDQIASQFNSERKAPPYTFADFKDATLHKDERPFKNLYILGTDVEKAASIVFSYETTPTMEVAEAVRISMSVPLLFESIRTSHLTQDDDHPALYVDGGLLCNYPINLFDQKYPPSQTLGVYFKSTPKIARIENIVDFISSALSCATTIQDHLFMTNPKNIKRSIAIQTGDVSAFNFDISPHDTTYNFLYSQGYLAAEVYFSTH